LYFQVLPGDQQINSNISIKPIKLDFKFSWLQCSLLIAIHLTALLSTYSINAPEILRNVLYLLVLFSFYVQMCRVFFLSPTSIKGIVIRSKNATLICGKGNQLVRITRVLYLSHLFTLLEIQRGLRITGFDPFNSNIMQLPLLIDSMSLKQRKDLHGYLNHRLKVELGR
jgi:hypothetical protein